MDSEVIRLIGNDWQDWADLLLSRHYGPTEYQKIPAKQGGDAGIEGFTVTKGHAYQCYGCDEPVSVKERYDSQRKKMTDDVAKFISNGARLLPMFGSTLISRWCLFVPVYDGPSIVAQATKKTEEVKAANLSYVANDFRVMVVDEKCFAKERDELTLLRPQAIHIVSDPTPPQIIHDWAINNDPLVNALDAKISKLPTLATRDERVTFRDGMIQHFLDGQNALQTLKKSYPTSYEKIVRLKYGKERFLKTESMIATGNPAEMLNKTIAALRESMKDEGCGVTPTTATALTYEAVADWLLRCPLDFPSPVNNVKV